MDIVQSDVDTPENMCREDKDMEAEVKRSWGKMCC